MVNLSLTKDELIFVYTFLKDGVDSDKFTSFAKKMALNISHKIYKVAKYTDVRAFLVKHGVIKKRKSN